MSTIAPHSLLNEITDFLSANPTPQEIIAFRPSEGLQNRALELLELNRQNRLSGAEREEMDTYMRMDHFLTILKAKVLLRASI